MIQIKTCFTDGATVSRRSVLFAKLRSKKKSILQKNVYGKNLFFTLFSYILYYILKVFLAFALSFGRRYLKEEMSLRPETYGSLPIYIVNDIYRQ